MTTNITVDPSEFTIGDGATEAEITGSGFTSVLKAAVLKAGCSIESYGAHKKSKEMDDEDPPFDKDIPIEQPPADYITDTSFPFTLNPDGVPEEGDRILVLVDGDDGIFGATIIHFAH
jgi:hypothetical protein